MVEYLCSLRGWEIIIDDVLDNLELHVLVITVMVTF